MSASPDILEQHATASVMRLEVPRRVLQLAAQQLPAGVNVLLVPPQDLLPEFIRLPDGRSTCPITGMGRTWVMDQVKASQGTPHKIKSHHMRARGSMKGVVLIDRASYVDYLRAQPAPVWASESEAAPAAEDDTDPDTQEKE